FNEYKNIVDENIRELFLNKNIYNNFDFSSVKLTKNKLNESINIETGQSSGYKDKYRILNDLIRNTFAMWEAGKEKENIFKQIYAWPKNENEKIKEYSKFKGKKFRILEDIEDNFIPVNCDEEYTEKLINEIAGKANTFKADPKAYDEIRGSRMFLVGEIGSGKTIFINNVFSRYHKLLADRKVIWIRIDLNNKIFRNRSLEEATLFQSAKIIRAHYYDDFEKTDKYNDFYNIIKEEYIFGAINKSEKDFKKSFDDFTSVFNERRRSFSDEKLIRSIVKYFEDQYAFIYVIDGLDRICGEGRFEEFLNNVDEICTNEHQKDIYIFVMRYESHYEYFLRNRNIQNLRGKPIFLKLFNADLNDILLRRLKFLNENLETQIEHLSPKYIYIDNTQNYKEELHKITNELKSDLRWVRDFNNLKAHFDIFFRFFYKAISFSITNEDINIKEWDISNVIFELSKLVGENIRHFLEIVQIAYNEFLHILDEMDLSYDDIINIYNSIGENISENAKKQFDTIMSKHYRVINSIVAIYYIKSLKYEYMYEDIPIKKIKIKDKKVYYDNSIYLYNIFNCINTNEEKEHYNLLLRIRVLQLINDQNNINRKEIQEIISANFGYKPDFINLALDELIIWKLLTYIPTKYGDEKYTIQITNLGNNFIENIIYDFNYIRMVLDDILFPEGLQMKFIDPKPDLYSAKKLEWSLFQIPRVFYFISLVKKIEELEKEFCNNKAIKLESWNISSKMYENCIDVITKIIYKRDYDYKIFNEVLEKSKDF
ncbi:hypothetical protein ACFLSQ_03830, partial [Bacteroidota bacterium]